MINVLVSKQSNYPVNAPDIKKRLRSFFASQGIVSEAEVSVVLVGEAKMLSLGKKYLKDSKLHNVLSFPENEVGTKFIMPPDEKIHLGEIIVCFPAALAEAKDEGKLIQEKVYELIEHGAMHLMGRHHE
jgi:rRNA maturation RNase YbeY